MSKLDAIWAQFGQLRANRNRWVHGQSRAVQNRWAHGVETPSPDQDSSTTADSGVSQQLRDAFIRANEMRPWPEPEHQTPKLVVDFVAKVAKRTQPASVIDPVCGYGMLLAGAAEAAGAENIHGVEINAEAVAIASIVLGEQATLVHGDAMAPHEGLLGEYDLIVADPPLGMRLQEEQATAIDLKSRSMQFADGLLVWAASRLNPGGVALVVVTPNFFFSPKSKQVHEAIQNAGCRIGAAIHIPGGTRIDTSIATYLLLVEPGDQGDIFVGQLSPDPKHQNQLLANLMRRTPKGSTSLGRVSPLSDFMGYESIVAQENLARLARDCGWTEHAAEAVFRLSDAAREGKEEELNEDAASLYLKLVGKGRASTRIDELRTGKSQQLSEVLHLKVDSEIADPTFMTHWFNESRIGRLSLDALRGGLTIPRIRPRDLARSKIYLPPISEQRLVVEGIAYLGKIRAETEELESALWSGTEPIEGLVEQIQSINQDDHYEDWLETLPFPLASILWKHYAITGPYKPRYEVLLHFFEMTAAFLATIHISAMMKDDDVWKEHGKRLTEKLSDQGFSLDRATFGSWKLVTELFSSACRAMINNKKQENLWQRLYGTTDLKVMEMISDSKLLGVLQQANKVRNDWAHSGAIDEDTAKSVHDQLVVLVNSLRGLFGRNWQRYELIQPDGGAYRQGLHHITSKRVMGTRSAPFKERVYESRDPLEAGSLYLFDSVHQSGLELRPFIEVIPSPEKKAVACYIYSRLEKKGARWLSYHFEQESEISHASQGVADTLDSLRVFDGAGE